jgi:gluconolactonase
VHPDGSIWFTDPPWGGQLYEGDVDQPGGPSNPNGKFNARAGQPAGFPMFKRELPTQVYRLDPSGTLDMVITDTEILYPNGLCFSPDYKHVYVVGNTPANPNNGGNIFVADVSADNKSVSNVRVLTECTIDGIKCGSDGLRADIDGNIWSSSNAGRNVGYSGVTVWDPSGKLLGRMRLPEVIGNSTFGGPKRNRLFMAGSTSCTPCTPAPRAPAWARSQFAVRTKPGRVDRQRRRRLAPGGASHRLRGKPCSGALGAELLEGLDGPVVKIGDGI